MKRVSMESTYTVPDGDVHLTIVFGDAQIGSSIVYLNDAPLRDGKIDALPIPIPPDKTSHLHVKSVVTDVNDKSNHTSITYTLSAGAASQTYSQNATVDREGDSIIYRAHLEMVRRT